MFAKLFLIALPVFFAIDMVWLAVVAKNFYQRTDWFFDEARYQLVGSNYFLFAFHHRSYSLCHYSCNGQTILGSCPAVWSPVWTGNLCDL